MSTPSKQSGFSVIELGILLVVVAIVGLLGYVAYDNFLSDGSKYDTATSEESPVANDVDSAPQIESSSDLDTALTTLDETDVEGSATEDEQRLDGELSAF